MVVDQEEEEAPYHESCSLQMDEAGEVELTSCGSAAAVAEGAQGYIGALNPCSAGWLGISGPGCTLMEPVISLSDREDSDCDFVVQGPDLSCKL